MKGTTVSSRRGNEAHFKTLNSRPQLTQSLNPVIHAFNEKVARCPFSLGEKVRMRDKPIPFALFAFFVAIHSQLSTLN